ncbi:MAG: hypothetical protein ABI462_04150 [Ignavibacteria bacterium]
MKKILISLVGLPAEFKLMCDKVNINVKRASVQGTKFGSCLMICFLFIILFNDSNAQVTVSGATVGNGNYATLSSAFTAINAGAQTGSTITILINVSISEPVSGAVLNNGAWTKLTISPSGGTAKAITSAVTAGSALISLNGADNVTIDGLNTDGNTLTISNTTVSNVTGTSTIRFNNDASNNVIKNCTILGSSTGAGANETGNIYFGSTGPVNGNDNNLISYCDIGIAGASLPSRGIYSSGSTASTARNNSGDTIRNCNIFDFFNNTNESTGIFSGSGSTNFTISENKFYQTSSRSLTTASLHSAINIATTTGNNFNISGNTIGYSSSSGTGVYTFSGIAGSRFISINLSVNSAAASNVQGNTIAGISVFGAMNGTLTSTPFSAIYCSAGLFNIGTITGNTIGSQSSTGSISYASSGSNSTVYAIGNFATTGNFTSSNNTIGGITLGGSGATNFCGIRSATSGTLTCQNNIIGGTIPNSIFANSTSTTTFLLGIDNAGGVSTISGNIIRNLTTSGGNTGTPYFEPLTGIMINSNATNHVISQNQIYSLTNTYTTLVTHAGGIYFTTSLNSGSNLISKNFIHSYRLSSTAGTMAAIYANAGTSTYSNNMIRLGISDSGTSMGTGCTINGILEAGGSNNIYYNSIYIGGSATSAASFTFAFQGTAFNVTRNYKNNVFYNARSNSGATGKHYGIRLLGSTPNPTGLTSDYNILYATGTGGALGIYNSVDRVTIAEWRTATGQDNNSYSSNPVFVNQNGTSSNVDLHIGSYLPTHVDGNGTVVAGVTDDFDGQTRAGLTPVDIGADAGNFIKADINPMTITYTDLLNDTVAGSRSFSNVVITDADGVQGSAGLRPRVYYKRKSDANAFNDNTSSTAGWKYAEANGSVSSFDFTINYALLNGAVTAFDTLQYFVVAQDLAATPNVASETAAFTTYPSNVALTAAAFPVSGAVSSFIFNKSPLAGDYIVGLHFFNQVTGRNIYFDRVVKKVMKEVSEIQTPITELNTEEGINKDPEIKTVLREVDEEIFIPMENGILYEGPLAVKRVNDPDLRTDAMAGVYATITAAINDINIWGVSGPVRFLLSDPSYYSESVPISITPWSGVSAINTVTIKPNTGVTSLIANNSSSMFDINGGDYFIIDGSNINGGTSKDLTINNFGYGNGINFFNDATNNIIKNCKLISSITTVNLSTTNGTTGNDNNIILNNDISGGSYGIINSGSGATSLQKNSGNQITGNRIFNFGFKGVWENGNSAGTIYTGNEFFHTFVHIQELYAAQFSSSTIEGATFTKNYIHDLKTSSTKSIFGISITGMSLSALAEISNNMISLDANSAFAVTGIRTTNFSNYNIYNNSILIHGNVSGNVFSVCYNKENSGLTNFKNNILINKVTGSSGSSYVLRNTGDHSFFFSDYNILKNDSSSNNKFGWYLSDKLNLNSWITSTAKDSHSVSADPLFIGAPNLHIDSTGSSPASNAGIPVAGITTDFDNNLRSVTAPDIGADEFNPPNPSGTLNLTMIMEGFYDQAADRMRAADSVKVYLRNSSSPYATVDSSKGIINAGTFTGSFTIANALSGNYYIQVRHRNTIDTWSAGAVAYTQGGTLNYNFTTSVSQAFGNNMKQVDSSPLRFGIYSADVTRDGLVNLNDIISTYNNASSFVNGYVVTDVTGDNVTNLNDILLAYNNSNAFVHVVKP